MIKRISWSYPTSPNAHRFGFNDEGCWTVSFYEREADYEQEHAGFTTYLEAWEYCEKTDGEYSIYSVHPARGRIADEQRGIA